MWIRYIIRFCTFVSPQQHEWELTNFLFLGWTNLTSNVMSKNLLLHTYLCGKLRLRENCKKLWTYKIQNMFSFLFILLYPNNNFLPWNELMLCTHISKQHFFFQPVPSPFFFFFCHWVVSNCLRKLMISGKVQQYETQKTNKNKLLKVFYSRHFGPVLGTAFKN